MADAPLKILIVDDSAVNCMVLEQLLKNSGQCRSVHDGGSAIAAIDAARDTKSPYHLVCLDMRIPPPEGLEVLKYIRAGGADTRVLVTTADGDAQQQAMDEGADAFMPKPYQRGDMIEALKTMGLYEG